MAKYRVDYAPSFFTGQLSGYVRFRAANYRIIAAVDNGELVLTNFHVGHRSEIDKKVKP